MAYAEAVTDPHQARGDFDDLRDGEDPMERAAKEFSRMAYCGKWEELALNLEGVI
jgi:hypothetical protein